MSSTHLRKFNQKSKSRALKYTGKEQEKNQFLLHNISVLGYSSNRRSLAFKVQTPNCVCEVIVHFFFIY